MMSDEAIDAAGDGVAPSPSPATDGDGYDYGAARRQLVDTRRRHAKALRQSGSSIDAIARSLNVTKDTVWRDLRTAGELTADDEIRSMVGRRRSQANQRLEREWQEVPDERTE